jgi:hypothetical protein
MTIEVRCIWTGELTDRWPDMCKTLTDLGMRVRQNINRPPEPGEVQWFGFPRRINGWESYDWQYLFHDDDAKTAMLFKLAWGGK